MGIGQEFLKAEERREEVRARPLVIFWLLFLMRARLH
jgi:hypothetical protein